MTIVPDEKDWTWVLERTCPECEFDASAVEATQVASMIRDNAASWEQALAGDSDVLRARPTADQWSTLEYACHVRDVFLLFDGRLQLMLSEDDPLFANWDQDATAIEQDYAAQDPSAVNMELVRAAAALADRFDQVSDSEWPRPGRRSDGAHFTIDTFARYLIHDPTHHLWDITHSSTLG